MTSKRCHLCNVSCSEKAYLAHIKTKGHKAKEIQHSMFGGRQQGGDESPQQQSKQQHGKRSPQKKINNRGMKQKLAQEATKARELMCQQEKAVTLNSVINAICVALRVDSWAQLRAGPFYDVPELASLQRLENSLFSQMKVYVKTRSLVTLTDMEKDICSLHKIQDFAALRIGPFIQNSFVRQHFMLGENDVSVPSITGVDVIAHIRKYRSKFKTGRIEIRPLMQYIAKVYHIEDATLLGIATSQDRLVRIAQMINNEQRRDREFHERLREGFETERKLSAPNLRKQMKEFRDKRDRTKEEELRNAAAGFVMDCNSLISGRTFAEALQVLESQLLISVAGKDARHIRDTFGWSSDFFVSVLQVCMLERIKGSTGGYMQVEQNESRGLAVRELKVALRKAEAKIDTDQGVLSVLSSLRDEVEAEFLVASFANLGKGDFIDFVMEHGEEDLVSRLQRLGPAGVKKSGVHEDAIIQAVDIQELSNFVRQKVKELESSFQMQEERVNSIEWISSLEERCNSVFGAKCFGDDASQPSSLCAFLKRHAKRDPKLLDDVNRALCSFPASPGGSVQIRTSELGDTALAWMTIALEVTDRQALPSGDFLDRLTALERKALVRFLCLHFGAHDLTALGLESDEDLEQLVRIRAEIAGMTAMPSNSNITPLCMLAFESLLGSAGSEDGESQQAEGGENEARLSAFLGEDGPLGTQSHEAALKALRNAPLLLDLSAATCWDIVFRPYHGALPDFVRSLPDFVQGLQLLEVERNRFVRVSQTASARDLKQAVADGDATAAVAGVLGQASELGGFSQLPRLLLTGAVRDGLSSLSSKESSARFVIGVLCHLPLAIRTQLAPLFLGPFEDLAGGSEARRACLQAAATAEAFREQCLQALHHVGLALGIAEWIEHYSATVEGRLSPKSGGRQAGFYKAEGQTVNTAPSTALPADVGVTDSTKGEQLGVHQQEGATLEELDVPPSERAEKAKREAEKCERVAQGVVDDVRKSMGYGAEVGSVAINVRDMLGRALERISGELYSDDVHFLLELIQNSDDNSYSTAVVPSLEFHVNQQGITVLNNERGFSEKNVRALCNVGKSTKSAALGFIGQKGIGFKSVFRVSNRPEVHSNGYHIAFDKGKYGDIGLVIPEWLEERPPNVNVSAWPTTICLPFAQGSHKAHGQADPSAAMEAEKTVKSKLNKLDSAILLFLKKIKRINIVDEDTGVRRLLGRREIPESHFIELTSCTIMADEDGKGGSESKETNLWLVRKKSLPDPPPRIKLRLEKTEVSIAFPRSINCSLADGVPAQQPVYAFLPLDTYGFRFVIQADFVVPSSRESVAQSSPWNEFIRSAIPDLFRDSFAMFHRMPSEEEENASKAEGGRSPVTACDWLRFVPLEGELRSFFRPLHKPIQRAVRSLACIPTISSSANGLMVGAEASSLSAGQDELEGSAEGQVEGGEVEERKEGNDGESGWDVPGQSRLADASTRQLLPPALLRDLLGLGYVDPRVPERVPKQILDSLGVAPLQASEVVEILRSLSSVDPTGEPSSPAARWSGKLSPYFVARCLVLVRSLLQRDQAGVSGAQAARLEKAAQRTYRDLATLPLIKLTNRQGLVAMVEQGRVEAPLLPAHGQRSSHGDEGRFLFEESLMWIDPAFFSCLDSVSNPALVQVLRQMGARRMSEKEVLEHYILPRLSRPDRRQQSPALVASHVAFICAFYCGLKSSSDQRDLIERLHGQVLLPVLCPQQAGEDNANLLADLTKGPIHLSEEVSACPTSTKKGGGGGGLLLSPRL